MKRIIIFLIAFMLATPAFSQELSKKERRQMEKELKKEQQAEEAAQKAALVNLMVHYQRFILEADKLRDKRGNTVNVSATLNFIAADSTSGVIQVGSNSYVGMNGVGGITVEGPLSNYTYSVSEKSGYYNVTYNLRTTVGTYDVRLSIAPDGRADATVSSSWPGKLNYSGYIVPIATSRVYQGTSY